MNINKNKSEEGFSMWGLFILSPILSIIFAFKNFRSPVAKNIFWAFTVFYGFTYVLSDNGMDSFRYRETFLQLATQTLTFNQFTETLYDVDSKQIDVFNPVVQYLVSRVTSEPKILFAVYGLFFGFFFSRNLWYLFDRAGPKLQIVAIPILVTFTFLSPIWDITGIRFNIAQHIFLYGALPFLFEKKKWKLIFCALTIFVHFAFLFPVAVMLVYIILGNRINFYFYFLIATLFVTEINVDLIRDTITNNLSEVFQLRTSGYLSDERIQAKKDQYNEDLNWYAKYYQLFLKWVIVICLLIIYIRGKKYIKSNKNMLRLMCFMLLMFGCANISNMLPSGGRFLNLSNLFALPFIFFYIQHGPKEAMLKRIIPISMPVLLLYMFVSLRIGLDTIGVLTVLGNPVTVLFFKGDAALINLIKSPQSTSF